MSSNGKVAVIIGAGPAGLTAASELLERSDVRPIVLERTTAIGGISQTINYKGNRMDIGGHRFFSKSDRVMDWWLRRLPLQSSSGSNAALQYQGKAHTVAATNDGPDPESEDRVMLLRSRKSRVYFLRQFFDYPIRLSVDTVKKLGPLRMVKIVLSYARASLLNRTPPSNLEEFFISRFGRELYLTFFKSYTEKVWGEECRNISAEWGAQRIKGLSIAKSVAHIFKQVFRRRNRDIRQKDVETSLIEQFLYPKLGPGQMWETVAEAVCHQGGTLVKNQSVVRIHAEGDRITAVTAVDPGTGQTTTYPADYVFSTMPVRELIDALDVTVPANVKEVSDGLIYRDFITVGLLVKRLRVSEHKGQPIKDNWIYIQEPDVLLGRLQVFNNWSPYMVANPDTTWLGLEYFCYETDDLWKLSPEEMIRLAGEELERIGIINAQDILDGTVVRVPKTYPAYFGTYDRFDEIRAFTDRFVNLFLVGRNGMHKYNNQDHSMLTAMQAVDNIVAGKTDKADIWRVNTEMEYHESRKQRADSAGRFDLTAYCVLAAISAVGAGFAAWAYPIWDDGVWEMFFRLGSDSPAADVVTDRPIFCWLLKCIYAAPRWFWFATVGLSFLTTWGLGLFTLHVARRVLPPRQALPTACLAAAPLLSRAQIVLVTYPLLLASVVGGFAAIYLLETALDAGRSRGELLWRCAAAVLIFVAAGLLTEYTVAVAAAGIVWLVVITWGAGGSYRRRGLIAAAALGILALAVFAVYHRLSDTAVRVDATPEVGLVRNLARPQVILPILMTSVYRGCLGEMLSRLGTIGLQSFLEFGPMAAALLVAGLVGYFCRNPGPVSSTEDRPRNGIIVGLIVAVTAGLLPLVLMGRWPLDSATESRFWVPVVPFAVCAFAGLANRLLNPKWLHYWPVFCAFLATWALGTNEATLWRDRTAIKAISGELRKSMPESGFCTAVFQDNWAVDLSWLKDVGLTAAITHDWPADEARRFWADPSLDIARKHGLSRYDHGEPLPTGMFRRTFQNFVREQKITRILWIRMPAIGQLEIWPTDVKDAEPPAKRD